MGNESNEPNPLKQAPPAEVGAAAQVLADFAVAGDGRTRMFVRTFTAPGGGDQTTAVVFALGCPSNPLPVAALAADLYALAHANERTGQDLERLAAYALLRRDVRAEAADADAGDGDGVPKPLRDAAENLKAAALLASDEQRWQLVGLLLAVTGEIRMSIASKAPAGVVARKDAFGRFSVVRADPPGAPPIFDGTVEDLDAEDGPPVNDVAAGDPGAADAGHGVNDDGPGNDDGEDDDEA